jgi:tetratricopeptide (TPR) repeat protein
MREKGSRLLSPKSHDSRAATSFSTGSQRLSQGYLGLERRAFGPLGDVVTKAGLLICTCFAIFLSSLYRQTAQNSPSRPESFEWDHQIELWDQAFYSYNYIAAERYGRRSLEIVDQLRLDDVKRATSLSSIAEALRFQKKYEQAEPLFRQALAIREKLLPPIHPRTAFSLEGLAATLVGLNRPTEAERYYL